MMWLLVFHLSYQVQSFISFQLPPFSSRAGQSRAEQSRNRGSINMVVSIEKKKEEELTGVEHDHHQYNNGNAQLQIQMSTQDSVSGFSIPTDGIVQQDDDSDEEDLEFGMKEPEEDVEVEETGVVMMPEEEMVFDPRDEGTSDFWIRRHPSLIRLTGKHPFNCEPPLKSLMENGFITPSPIHYVRNHGYVPKATWDNWSVEVCDAETTDDLLVKRPTRFSMEDLVGTFPYHEFPVTLVCAGNRRKEQNMVKQTIGFNWGPAAISTAVWRGVRLRDVLKRCGVVTSRGLYVWFEGEEDLPGGGGSKYGTSLPLEVAMDPSAAIMLAYKMNGQVLPPDHGFPVRMIIPGFIGGRMVKWLRRITVARQESQNYYHFKDNRVLPSVVPNADIAQSQGWWYKPEYIINELNINSVITTPCHDDIMPINTVTTQEPYVIRGYAYSGGGRKVTRVEVTLDGGETWKLCNVDHPEKPNKYGKYWCWCFWSVEVQGLDLLRAKAIAVRAWDQSQNTQPEKLNWNLMGMMNNCWFQVKISICRPNKGELGLVFEHPTQPGNTTGGWMARQKHVETSDTQVGMKKSFSAPSTNITKQYSLSNVKKHNSRDSAWIVVHGSVYDCTAFIDEHPGGVDSILINAGTDCTEEFDAIHSDKAKAMLEMYRIGELVTTGYTSDASVHGGSSSLQVLKELSSSPPAALIPREKIPCTLVSKMSVSHDVRLFRFALPYNDQTLGLPVGKHIFLCTSIDGKLCMRAYTPTSKIDQLGYFDLVVKVYHKDVHHNFPKGGLMSQHLDSLPLGSSLDIKGPLGHIEYKGKGNFLVNGKAKWARRLAMVAGGTGITPIYQVMQAILADPEDVTEMWLVYANRTEDDVLLKDEIDGWFREHPCRVRVWYVVGRAKREGWPYGTGRVSEDVLRDHIPLWSNDTLALACGPPPMIQLAVEPGLKNLGYDESSLLVF